MKLIDIHSHINFSDFDDDREEVIARMKENSVSSIVVGTDKETSKQVVALAEKHPHLFASVGLHPTDSKEDFDVNYYRELAKHPKVVAIGECGLDYYHSNDSPNFETIKEEQKEVFKKQIELAIETDKPLMIHCRNAYEEVWEILNSPFTIHHSKLRGNMHFFAGDWETARKFLDIGLHLSFTGVITFTDQYNEIIKKMPLERLMTETDAPFVAPAPYRGKRNEPSYVVEVAKKIAELRGLTLEQIAETITQNAQNLFRI